MMECDVRESRGKAESTQYRWTEQDACSDFADNFGLSQPRKDPPKQLRQADQHKKNEQE
jgi:hypothetical protein